MRPSASSTDPVRARARGFTLVEVAIAASLLAVMLTIVLQLFSDTTKVSGTAIARADLRRIGERVLSGIADDLRSSSTTNCSLFNATPNGQAIEFYKIADYDTTTTSYIREKDNNGIDILRRYSQGSIDPKTGMATLNFYKRALAGSLGAAIPGTGPSPFKSAP